MALADSLAPLRAIVWAQSRTSWNFFLRANKGGVAFKWIMGLIWYGVWLLAAAGAGFLLSGRVPMLIVERALPGAFFLVCFFWQLFPIVMASQGAFLDLKRLLAYPIPNSQLFLLETALRVTTAVEMILICAGLIVGLLLNPELPAWGALAVALLMVFNLLLATGIKSLLDRLFQKKGVRELLMVLFLGLILVPQLLVVGIESDAAPRFGSLRSLESVFRLLPWSSAAALALGRVSAQSVASLLAATGLAFLFARLQFFRSLRLDEESGAVPSSGPVSNESTWFDRLCRLPSALFPDPIATVVEKDVRTLVRTPRFRLIFLMASTFGAVLWLPQVLRSKDGWLAQNYLTMATLYGMLVLGEVLYWNVFGFERAAAQQWFVTPVRFRDILRAKNRVAVIFTLLSMSVLATIAAFLPIPLGPAQIADTLAAASVFLIWILAAGNLTSVYLPRPMNAEQAWRNTGGKTQFLLVFAYPFLSIPVALAHLSRWALESYWAYHGVLVVSFLIGWCFYTVATETAEEVAELRKEQIVAALVHQEGPMSITS